MRGTTAKETPFNGFDCTYKECFFPNKVLKLLIIWKININIVPQEKVDKGEVVSAKFSKNMLFWREKNNDIKKESNVTIEQ